MEEKGANCNIKLIYGDKTLILCNKGTTSSMDVAFNSRAQF